MPWCRAITVSSWHWGSIVCSLEDWEKQYFGCATCADVFNVRPITVKLQWIDQLFIVLLMPKSFEDFNDRKILSINHDILFFIMYSIFCNGRLTVFKAYSGYAGLWFVYEFRWAVWHPCCLYFFNRILSASYVICVNGDTWINDNIHIDNTINTYDMIACIGDEPNG